MAVTQITASMLAPLRGEKRWSYLARARTIRFASLADCRPIDGTSGEYNETRTVRISTPAPPQSLLDGGRPIHFAGPVYDCLLQVGAAGSTWQPPVEVRRTPPRPPFLTSTFPPAAWAWSGSRLTSDALLVHGELSVPAR